MNREAPKPHMIEKRSERRITIGGAMFTTNLPENSDIFKDETPRLSYGSRGLGYRLLPSNLDDLPVGEYWVSGRVKKDGEILPRKRHQNITVLKSDEANGKAITLDSFGSEFEVSTFTAGVNIDKMLPVFSHLGFVIDGGGIVAVPTPVSLQNAAKYFGIDIRLFPEFSLIPYGEYIQSFASGQYPVGTGGPRYFHDIADDHLTAIVLGGIPLRDSLQKAAKKAEEDTNSLAIEYAAFEIDMYTTSLRLVTLEPHESYKPFMEREKLTKADGRQTLISRGSLIDIPSEETELIIETAQANAQKFGIPVMDLE